MPASQRRGAKVRVSPDPSSQTSQSAERIEILRKIPLFKSLTEADLVLISSKITEVLMEPHTDLLIQNQEADGVYFLKEGSVEILVNGEMVALKNTIECFGEMSCLLAEIGDKYASATVRTVVPSKVLKILRADFLEAVNQIPLLWKSLFMQMTGRFKDMGKRLSEVLSHTPQGLVKIDKAGKITNEFSIHCTKYFQSRQLAGKAFHELAFAGQGAKQEAWNKVYASLFDVPVDDFGLVAQLLPPDTQLKQADGSMREYLLTYYPCIAGGVAVAVDVGVEDVTEARAFERRNAALEVEKQILRKVYDNPDSYMTLLELADIALRKLPEVSAMVSRKAGPQDESFSNDALRMLHSLKGLSGQFSVSRMSEAAHQMESLVQEHKTNRSLIDEQVAEFNKAFESLRAEGEYAKSLIENLSKDLRDRLLGVSISKEQFSALKSAVQERKLDTIEELLKQVEKVDARRWVQSWPMEAARLCEKLGKRARLKVEGDALLIPQSIFHPLEAPLLHLLRNSLDHGIESPDERAEGGKDPEGQITVSFRRESDGQVVMEVSDDGRGLDYPAIIAKAKENHLLDPKEIDALVSSGEEWKILLLPGFSMAKKVTEISGRGIGLDAVREVVDSLQGSMRIKTEPGMGTAILIQLAG